MKTYNAKVRKIILDLVKLSFTSKEKGHDVFVRINPRSCMFDVDVFVNGWGKDKDKNYTGTWYNHHTDDEAMEILQKVRELVK